jgi:hypothetical protein
MSFAQFQILMAAGLGLLVLIPVALAWRLLARRGRGGWGALLLPLPGINLASAYLLAFRRRRRDRLAASPPDARPAVPHS